MDDLSNEIAWDSYEFYTEQLFKLEEDHLSNMDKVTNVLQGGSYCNKQDHLEIFNKSLEVTSQLIVLYNKQLSSIQDMLIALSDEKDEQLKNPQKNQIDYIDWIELIKFKETRNYVQRVLENYNVYRYILEQKPITMKNFFKDNPLF